MLHYTQLLKNTFFYAVNVDSTVTPLLFCYNHTEYTIKYTYSALFQILANLWIILEYASTMPSVTF